MILFRKIRRFIPLALFVTIAFSTGAFAQQYSVQGTITASGTPVRNASVTFLDNTNSSISYSAVTDSNGTFDIGSITGIKSNGQTPVSFKLEQNYPNPFASKTAISYDLAKNSDSKVTIFNVLGQKVRSFSMGVQSPGVHGVIWNGRDNFGNRVAPGVYFYRLQADGQSVTRKMLFGFGAANAPVSLSGMLPSAASPTSFVKEVGAFGEDFTVVITNSDSTDPLIVPADFSSIRVNSDTTLGFTTVALKQATVYSDSTQQLIEGFGSANTVNWDAGNLTPAEVATVYDTAAGDLGFSIMRLRIAPDSMDFSASIPSAKQAQSYGTKIIASPWTPPYWMKTNDSMAGGYLDTNEYAAYAAHLKAFADTMAAGGVNIYAISVQNEPDAVVTYESCFWTPSDILRFMKYYAPEVGVPVFMPESENFNTAYSDPTLEDSVACAHTAFVGGHLYGPNLTTNLSPFVYSLALSKGKQVWMTEILNENTSWSGDLSTGKQINDCMFDDMSAYVYWWTLVYYGPLDQSGQITKRGYVISQYARFVRPGYYRVYATENPQPNVYLTAYTGNGKTVIVVVNMNSYPTLQPFSLMNSSVASFTPYVTSSTENRLQGNIVGVSNGSFTAALEASSITTYVSN